MEQISRQLLFQRLRNRVIELLDLYSSFEDIATIGAFEALNWTDDLLPIDYHEAPNVFNEDEKRAVTALLKLVEITSDATPEDSWDAKWFANSAEWCELSNFSQKSLCVFVKRGRFSEGKEDITLT